MTENEKKFVIEIRGKTNQAITEIKKLNKTVKNLDAQINKSNKSIDSQVKKTKALSLGFKQLGAHLTRLAVIYGSMETARKLVTTMNDLEQSLTGVSRTTGISGEALKELSDKLDDMSMELKGIDISSLQDIAQSAGQLGVKGSDNILLFTKQVAKISVAVDMTADETASAFARLQNATGEPIDKMENLASAVNDLSQSSTATVPEILHFSKNLSSASANAGLTAQEIVALAATLRDVGSTAEAGGTAISRLMADLVKDSDKYANALGQDMSDFATLVEDEPIKALQMFMEHYQNLSKQAKGQFLDNLGLKSAEMVKTIGLVSGQFDKLTEHLKTSNKAYLQNISIQQEFDIQSKTMESTYIDLNNAFTLFTKKLMSDLIPALNRSMTEVTDFINSLSEEQIKEFADSLAGLIDTIGNFTMDVLDATSSVFNFFKEISEATGISGEFMLQMGSLAVIIVKLRGALGGLKEGVDILKFMWGASPQLVLLNTTLAVTIGLFARWESLTAEFNRQLEVHTGLVEENIGFLNISAEAYKKLGIESRKAFSNELRNNISKTKTAIKDLTEEIRKENAKWFTNDDVIKTLSARKKNLVMTLTRMEEQQKKNLEIDEKQNKVDLEALKVAKKKEAEENREITRKKKLVEAQKTLFTESKKTAESRLATSESTMKQLYANERKLVSDIIALQRGLSTIHRKYADERVAISEQYNKENYNSLQKSRTDIEQYHSDLRRSEKLHQDAILALKKGDIADAERLGAESHALTMKWRGEEISSTREKNVLNKQTRKWEKESITELEVTASQSRARTDQGMKDSLALSLSISKAKEAEEIRLQNLKIDNKIAELELVKSKMAVEMELMQNFKKIIETVNNTQIDLNFDVSEMNIKKMEDRIDKLTKTKKTIPLSADTTQVDASINRVIAKTETSKPKLTVLGDLTPYEAEIVRGERLADEADPQMLVDGNLTPYEKRMVEAIRETDEAKPTLNVDANTDKANKKVDNTKKEVKNIDKVIPKVDVDKAKADRTIVTIADHVSSLAMIEPTITVTIVSNIAKVRAEILKLNQLRTNSMHVIGVDASAVWREKRRLMQTTSSTHIIYVRTVGGRADGGLVEHLASGGQVGEFKRRRDKISGHDLSGKDDVPTMLTRGEYVTDVRTVDYYGEAFFRQLKARMIPKYATGGLVGSTPSSANNKVSGKTVNLNLNIGGNNYATIADEEVASALERVLRRGV